MNDVGLESHFESEMVDFGQRPFGHNFQEEEKVPNISKTRINDNSAIQYTNSNFDGNSMEMDQERMDFNELTKNFNYQGSRNEGSGIDAQRAKEL